MRNTKHLLLLLSFVFFSSLLKAQQDSTKEPLPFGIIKWHPLQPGEIFFSFEKPISSKYSFEAGAGYVRKFFTSGEDMNYLSKYPASGFSVRLNWKHYNSNGPFGFYHGPMLLYRMINYKFTQTENDTVKKISMVITEKPTLQVLGLEYLAGWQFQLFNFLTVNPSLGVGIRMKYVDENQNDIWVKDKVVGYRLTDRKDFRILFTPSVHFGLNVGFVIPGGRMAK